MLIADSRRLLKDAVRGVWHFTGWSLEGDELAKTGVNVSVEVTDEAAPTRYFYEDCAIPPSFGECPAAPRTLRPLEPTDSRGPTADAEGPASIRHERMSFVRKRATASVPNTTR